MTDHLLVLTTCGSAEEADRIARGLVEQRLAACVNVLPEVRSIYRWKGAVEHAPEWMLVIKTTRRAFDKLRAEIARAHSYDVPEVIALPITDGAESYLNWIDTEVMPE